MNIFASEEIKKLIWDSDAKKLRSAIESDTENVFTVKALNYWEIQPCIDKANSDAQQIREGLLAGIVAIDGDKDRVAKFIANPSVSALPTELYSEIIGLSTGN